MRLPSLLPKAFNSPSVLSTQTINLRTKVGSLLYDCKTPYFKPLGDTRLWNVSKVYEKVGTVFRLV